MEDDYLFIFNWLTDSTNVNLLLMLLFVILFQFTAEYAFKFNF